VYGSQDVLDSCQNDLFNNRIWPDFIALSRDNDKPFLKLSRFEAGQTIELDGLRFTAVALDHVVPTVGYIVADQNASVAFVSDTGPTEAVWEAANAASNLKAVFVEACFPDRMEWLAKVSKHLTPTMLAGELKKLHRPARIIIVHIKARFQDEVVAELKALANPQLEIAQFGVPYSF
jgi:ribonuclease BN (tRNA processing enzyme)